MKILLIFFTLSSSLAFNLVKKDCLLQFQIDVERADRVEAVDSENCPGGIYSAYCTTEVEAAHNHAIGTAATNYFDCVRTNGKP